MTRTFFKTSRPCPIWHGQRFVFTAFATLVFSLYSFAAFGQNVRFSYQVFPAPGGATTNVKFYIQNISATPENFGSFNLYFYYNNTETTLSNVVFAPYLTPDWTSLTSTAHVAGTAGPGIPSNLGLTGAAQINAYDGDGPGKTIAANQPPTLILDMNFSHAVGTPAAGFGFLANNADVLQPAPPVPATLLYLPYLTPPIPDPIPWHPVIVMGLQAQALPLDLVAFQAAPMASKTIGLLWQTEGETAFAGFDIERSTNGFSFEKIGFEKAKGGADRTSYSFSDGSIEAGRDYYYRLKMLDLDGRFTFSAIKKARLEGASLPGLFPNPVDDRLMIDWQDFAPDRLLVFDALSREVFSMEGLEEDLRTELTVEALPAGLYFIRAFSGRDEVATLRFLKN